MFQDFDAVQNHDLNGNHPIIADETGLPQTPRYRSDQFQSWDEYAEAVNLEQFYVATDSPWFAGEDARQMARNWYKNQFGITFREETRPTTIHVIRKKR